MTGFKTRFMKKVMSILGTIVLLTSCSGNAPTLNVIKNNPVEGILKDYIEVVDQPYKFEFEHKGSYPKGMDYQAYVNVKFKLIKPFDETINQGYNEGINITIKFLDENETQPISETIGLAPAEKDEFEEWIKSGKGEKVFRMRGGNSGGEKDFFEKADWTKVKYFRIFSTMK